MGETGAPLPVGRRRHGIMMHLFLVFLTEQTRKLIQLKLHT
jgi:hypothetical protein